MPRTPEESRPESKYEIQRERKEMRDALARGELEANLTLVRDSMTGDEARLRYMRFGFVVDSIRLGDDNRKTFFFNGNEPEREREEMRQIMADPAHAGIALALDAINALRYDPGAKKDVTAPENFSQVNRPI